MRYRILLGEQHDGTVEVANVVPVNGSVAIDIAPAQIDFNEDGWHAAMSPAKARKLAEGLLAAADEAEEYRAPVSEDDIYKAFTEDNDFAPEFD